MGSSESKTTTGTETSDISEPKTSGDKGSSSSRFADDEKAKSLSGVDLVNYKCRRKEKAYKKCVSKNYNEFLAGKSIDQEEVCGELFERYRRCYLKGMQKVVWGEDSPPPAKGSTLAVFAQEEEEEKKLEESLQKKS